MLECDVIEIIGTESLVPEEHLLLKIDVEVDFIRFIGHHRLYSIEHMWNDTLKPMIK